MYLSSQGVIFNTFVFKKKAFLHHSLIRKSKSAKNGKIQSFCAKLNCIEICVMFRIRHEYGKGYISSIIHSLSMFKKFKSHNFVS